MALELQPLAPSEAVRFFEDKGYEFSFDWRDVWQQEHARAFTVAKAMRQDVLTSIRGEVDRALRDGVPFEEFRKSLTPRLQELGWWGRQEMTDPLTGETKTVQLGSPRRLRTIYDTNLRSARAAGRWERIERNRTRRPYLRYSAVLDSRTRPQHRAWHSLILPIDHPFWETHYPPNGWNCRCIVQQLSERDLDRRGWSVSSDQDVQDFLDRTRQYRNKRTGEVTGVPEGIDPGFSFNMGKAHMRGLSNALGGSLAKADSAVGRQTLGAVMNSEPFSDFLQAPERWDRFPVMLMDDDLRGNIGSDSPVVFLSADTLIKNRNRHPDIAEAEYRGLADLAASADLVIRDSERTVVLLRQGDNWLMASVKATESGQANFVTSVRRARQNDVDRLLRRGDVIRDRR